MSTSNGQSSSFNAAIYCRVSTPGQKDNGSLEEQDASCHIYCHSQGWNVDADQVYHEVFSGDEPERPKLQLLMKAAQLGHFQVLVLDKVDRFSRADETITAYLMYQFHQIGIKVVFLDAPDESPMGELLQSTLRAYARFEWHFTRRRTQAGRRRRAGEFGKLMTGGMPLYGYTWNVNEPGKRDSYLIDEESAPTVRRIFTDVACGKPLSQIRNELMNEGLPTPTQLLARRRQLSAKQHVSSRWHIGTITRMIHTPAYWGEHQAWRWKMGKTKMRDPRTGLVKIGRTKEERPLDSEERIVYDPAVCPPIVTKELASAAQARLRRNKDEAARNGRKNTPLLLRCGHIYCDYCGQRMVAGLTGEGRHRVYRCPTAGRFARREVDAPCPGNGCSIGALKLDEGVWEHIIYVLQTEGVLERALEAARAKQTSEIADNLRKVAALAEAIANAQSNIEALTEQVKSGTTPQVRAHFTRAIEEEYEHISGWEAMREQLSEEFEDANRERQAAIDLTEAAKIWGNSMRHFTYAEKRAVLYGAGIRICVRRPHDEFRVKICSDLEGVLSGWLLAPAASLGDNTESYYNTHFQKLVYRFIAE